ncbi:MAG: hypothetical protein ACYSSI_13235 [Planctomycetota bacterium]|jgi:hypothetical protein
MMKKINYGKIFIVCLLTVLIWIWADLAKTEKLPPVKNAVISASKSISRELLVSFDDKPEALIEEIVLSGPTSKISEFRRKLDEGTIKPVFFYDPDPRAIANGEEVINLRDCLSASQQIKQLGLAVKSCKPATFEVQIQKLVKKPLKIRCLDDNKNILSNMVVEPPEVEMFVPADWEGETLVADIRLSDNDVSRAREMDIKKTPYIEVHIGHPRWAETPVKVKALAEEGFLKEATITNVTLGFTLTENLLGRYDVKVENFAAVTTPITVLASQAAKLEYEAMNYQVILEILDEDRVDDPSKPSKPNRRELVYNFPTEYVRKKEIGLSQNQQPVMAQFRLVPKTPKPQE